MLESKSWTAVLTPFAVPSNTTQAKTALFRGFLAPMGDKRTAYVPDTELVGIVTTRIQRARGGYTNDHTQHLQSLQRRWGDELVRPYIVQGTGVAEALAGGLPVYNYHETQNVGRRRIDGQYIQLVREIKERIDAL